MTCCSFPAQSSATLHAHQHHSSTYLHSATSGNPSSFCFPLQLSLNQPCESGVEARYGHGLQRGTVPHLTVLLDPTDERSSSAVSVGRASCRRLSLTGIHSSFHSIYRAHLTLYSLAALHHHALPGESCTAASTPQAQNARHSHFTRAPATGAIEARRWRRLGAALALLEENYDCSPSAQSSQCRR